MNEKPKERKPNRIPGYNYSLNGVYFITICADKRKCLFSSVVGGGAIDAPKIRLSSIGKIIDKYILSSENINGVHIDKYVIMPNHLHLLIEIDSDVGMSNFALRNIAPSPTSAKIPHLVSTLKRFVNHEIGYNVFQRSYYDHVVRNEKDYLIHWEYVDTNPIKWETDDYYIKN